MLKHCVFLPTILILAQFSHGQSFLDAFAEDTDLPDWVFKLFEFWQNGYISNTELGNAVKYLQEHNVIRLVMEKEYDPITNFLITSSLQKESTSNQFSNCSSDWYITGYFTPVESDYSSDFTKITFGDNIKHFRSDFLSKVKTEGWGKNMLGEYIGWYDNSFHLSDAALDSHGDSLLVQSVAVDPDIIKQKTKLVIPKLPNPWNEMVFTSSDIGPSIKGKHIDVYTGEGKQAELETFRITGTENDVCTEPFED